MFTGELLALGFRRLASGFRLLAPGPDSRLPAYRLLRGGADALISEILNFLR